jgi:ParB family chromosome partitioning protein
MLQPGRYQPRSHMDSTALESLAESIRTQGVIQPILIRPIPGGRYEIIAGERRWRAAHLAGLDTVPVIVRDIPDEATLAVALIENIQRENLNAVEEAQGIARLLDEFQMTHEQAAKAVGRSRAAVSNLLRLLDLEPSVLALLAEGALDMGHARALLALPLEDQPPAALDVIDNQLSVRATEQLVQRWLSGDASSSSRHGGGASPKPKSGDMRRLEEELSDSLGVTVALKVRAKGGGDLVIRYHSLDELDGVLARLRGAKK